MKDEQIRELTVEKDKAFEQLREMVNQTKFEKQSIEEKLQIQLTDTLKQLQQKEKELHEKERAFEDENVMRMDAENRE